MWLLAIARGCGGGREVTNRLGMRLVRIPAGSFTMGETAAPIPEDLTAPLTYDSQASLVKRFPFGDPARFGVQVGHVESGDFDEKPARRVRIRNAFHMGAHEVTNRQYEVFDPSHRALRGRHGYSKEDDEAAVFVSWHEAETFCEWLSKKEGRRYRLPTGAEWEYACRGGTGALCWTGNALPAGFHKNPRNSAFDEPADVTSSTTQAARGSCLEWGGGRLERVSCDLTGPYAP